MHGIDDYYKQLLPSTPPPLPAPSSSPLLFQKDAHTFPQPTPLRAPACFDRLLGTRTYVDLEPQPSINVPSLGQDHSTIAIRIVESRMTRHRY